LSKSIKFKNNTYLDSTSIVHNKETLSVILSSKFTSFKTTLYSNEYLNLNSNVVESVQNFYAVQYGKIIQINALGTLKENLTTTSDLVFGTFSEKYRPIIFLYQNGDISIGSSLWKVKEVQYSYFNSGNRNLMLSKTNSGRYFHMNMMYIIK